MLEPIEIISAVQYNIGSLLEFAEPTTAIDCSVLSKGFIYEVIGVRTLPQKVHELTSWKLTLVPKYAMPVIVGQDTTSVQDNPCATQGHKVKVATVAGAFGTMVWLDNVLVKGLVDVRVCHASGDVSRVCLEILPSEVLVEGAVSEVHDSAVTVTFTSSAWYEPGDTLTLTQDHPAFNTLSKFLVPEQKYEFVRKEVVHPGLRRYTVKTVHE